LRFRPLQDSLAPRSRVVAPGATNPFSTVARGRRRPV